MADYKIHQRKLIYYPDKKVNIIYGESKNELKYVRETVIQEGIKPNCKSRYDYLDLSDYFWKRVMHHNDESNKEFGLESKVNENVLEKERSNYGRYCQVFKGYC